MRKSMERNRFVMLVASVCLMLLGATAFAKPKPEAVKEEAGYYYGYGKGDTMDQALLEAKRDLVESALTATLKATNAKASRVKVSDASAEARVGNLKPYVQSSKKEPPAVTYRVKIDDWQDIENEYAAKIRTDLDVRVKALPNKRSFTDKMSEALSIFATLNDIGETNLLTAQAEGSELLSARIESICKETSKTLTLTLSVADKLVNSSTKFTVTATDTSGTPIANLSLATSWDVAALPTDNATIEAPSVTGVVKTNSNGTAAIDYPSSEAFQNRAVVLTVSTTFATVVPSSTIRKLDAENSVDGCYDYYNDFNSAFATVAIPAGKFNAGAVPQDTRAKKVEAAHEAETDAYEMSVTLVTNAQYAAYLNATRATEMPEYFDNNDYNQGNQPIVGISLADAEAYAAWLSEQTGNTYRLPTEEEYEKAARGGNDTVYPWGDDSPASSKNANYKGNGTFKGPSPVGSFGGGKNSLGLVDMVGNVWEWTTSTRSKDAETTSRIVKGGSWMDGPTDLRISNFVERDSSKGYVDVGFRLVKEVSK